MAVVKLNVVRSKTRAQIEALTSPINGALYFASDSPDVYLGNGTSVFRYSGIEIATVRPAAPVQNQLYLIGVSANYALEFYISGTWETLVSSLTLGETQFTAYRGDRGKIAYDHSLVATGNPHSVTKTEVGLGNVLNTEQVPTTEKGVANGVATLDGGGKIPSSQLPSSVMEYKGMWNANTNTPTLADGVGDNGDVYLVSVAGTQNLGSGSITFAAGDWIVYNGTIWEKSLNSDAVVSVNGYTGVVTLDTDDIVEGSTNFYTQWVTNGSDVYYNGGNVGIGTDSPANVLPNGFATTDSKSLEIRSSSTTGDTGLFIRRSDNNVGLDIWSDNGNGRILFDSRWNNNTANAFLFRTKTSSTPLNALAILGNGSVGIGTTNSNGYKLNVDGTTYFNGNSIVIGSITGITESTSENSTKIASTAWVKNQGYTTNTGTVTSIATSGAITGGPITTSGTITHLDTAGYKHIPTGGSSGQVLIWSASGTAVWSTPSGGCSFGSDNQIPHMNSGGTDFDYSDSFTWNGYALTVAQGGDDFNIFIGKNAGNSTVSGASNTMVGILSGWKLTTGDFNSAFGRTGGNIRVGSYNSFMGAYAGASTRDGSSNTCVGYGAGNDIVDNSGSVHLGYFAGRYNTESDRLYVDNQSRTNLATQKVSSLIYGEFNSTVASQMLRVNANLHHNGSNLGFYGTTPITKPAITGSRNSNAALTSLLTQLSNLGLITDSTT